MSPPNWLILWLIRILWTILPQTGYIYPDEYFQSTEVVAGDVLNFTVYRTWEFDTSNPIRSVTIPYFLTAPAFYFLHILGLESSYNALLITPRIVMTLLSFCTDLLVYHTAKVLSLNADAVVMTYATSYITMVYHTRTLSNTVESFLFVALLCLVIKSGKGPKTMVSEVHPRSKLTKSTRMKELHCNDHDFEYASGIALILVAGFFNRPTFAMFALMPCFFWMTNGYFTFWKDELLIATTFKRILYLLFIAVPIKWIFTLLDSAYYRDFDFSLENGLLASLTDFLVSTPFNFIMYNSNSENLADHTLHPYYLHFAVNAQLLFGFLSIFALVSFVKTISSLKYLVPHHIYTWKIFVLYCYIVPLCLLSLFPHQEPRFLIPLLFPLVLVFGHHIFGAVSYDFWQAIWIIFNVIAALFYGTLHQGGMISAINTVRLQHAHSLSKTVPNHHVIFYNTYMPPRHLFAIPDKQNEVPSLVVHDLAGQNPIEIVNLVQKINKFSDEPAQIFFVAPRTAESKFCNNAEIKALKRLDFQLLHQFFPHVSTENLPSMEEFGLALKARNECSGCGNFLACKGGEGKGLMGLFSLNLYHVTVA